VYDAARLLAQTPALAVGRISGQMARFSEFKFQL
jgi:hypothetical protein